MSFQGFSPESFFSLTFLYRLFVYQFFLLSILLFLFLFIHDFNHYNIFFSIQNYFLHFLYYLIYLLFSLSIFKLQAYLKILTRFTKFKCHLKTFLRFDFVVDNICFNLIVFLQFSELKTLEWWISGLMLNPNFFLISRLNMACSPHEFNLQKSQQIRIKDITF